MISKVTTGILKRFSGGPCELDNIFVEWIDKDNIRLTAATGFILVTVTAEQSTGPRFESFMINRNDLPDDDCELYVMENEVYFIGGAINKMCIKQPGDYPNTTRAMHQAHGNKPTPQELDCGFMKTIVDTAKKVSDVLYLSPGNDKEALIIIADKYKFAVMPRN